jgi:hypothetical protein
VDRRPPFGHVFVDVLIVGDSDLACTVAKESTVERPCDERGRSIEDGEEHCGQKDGVEGGSEGRAEGGDPGENRGWADDRDKALAG